MNLELLAFEALMDFPVVIVSSQFFPSPITKCLQCTLILVIYSYYSHSFLQIKYISLLKICICICLDVKLFYLSKLFKQLQPLLPVWIYYLSSWSTRQNFWACLPIHLPFNMFKYSKSVDYLTVDVINLSLMFHILSVKIIAVCFPRRSFYNCFTARFFSSPSFFPCIKSLAWFPFPFPPLSTSRQNINRVLFVYLFLK